MPLISGVFIFFIILIFNVSNVSNVSEDLPDELSFSLPEPVIQP